MGGKIRAGLFGVSVLAIGISAAPLFAQTASGSDAAAEDAASGVRDIVVTGQRRASTVQDTGAAIAVISADDLQSKGVNSSMGLQFATPGITISQDLGLQTQIFIRGIGSNLQGIATGNSVATYVDGVYIPNSIQSAQQFSDIERVEVLKGPQATLYGRNATGGAVIIVSQEPGFDFTGAADFSYGNYNAINARARVNVPIIEDRLAISIAGQVGHRDGYVENLYTGNRLNYENNQAIRGALKAVVSEDVEIILRADYTHWVASDVYKLFPRTASYYFTPPNTLANQTPGPQWFSPDPRKVYYDVDPVNPAEDRGYSATIRWDTGIGKITSVTSRRLFDAGPYVADSDQVPTYSIAFGVPINTRDSKQGSDSFYHDTFLATETGSAFDVIVGGNYFHDKQYSIDRATIQWANNHAKVDAWSVYADATFDINENIRLLAGARYSSEVKSYTRDNLRVGTGALLSTASNRRKFTSFDPRVGVEFRTGGGTLIYATATSGFKSGGFNPTIPGNDFAPESIWAYEAGVKTRFWDNRITFAGSAFYYDYSDIQVLQYITIQQGVPPVATLVQNITNGASAKLWGIDTSATVDFTDNFTVNAAVSYLHSEFGSTIFCDPLQGSCTATNPADRPNVNVRGNSLARAPKLTANFSAEYRIPVSGGEFSIRGNAAFRDRVYYTVFENPFHSGDPYWLLGGNIRFKSNDNWFLEIFGQNLTNELAITNMINTSPVRNSATGQILVGSPGNFERYVAPRTYGVRLGFDF